MAMCGLLVLVIWLSLAYVQCPPVRKNVTVALGGMVRLSCSTLQEVPVDWMYNGEPLYVNGEIDASLRSRYSIDKSNDGQYTAYMLVISDFIAADAGEYTCIDNAGSGPELVTYIIGEYMAALTTARQSDEAETHWLVIGLLIGFLVAVIVILAVIAVILRQQYMKQRRHITADTTELQEKKQLLTESQQTMKEKISELEQTKIQNESLEEKNKKLEQDNQKLQKTEELNESLTQKNQYLKEKNNNLEREIKKLNDDIRNKLPTTNTQLECSKVKIEGLQKELKEKKDELEKQLKERKAVMEERDTLICKLSETGASFAEVKAKLEVITEQKIKSESELQQWKDKCPIPLELIPVFIELEKEHYNNIRSQGKQDSEKEPQPGAGGDHIRTRTHFPVHEDEDIAESAPTNRAQASHADVDAETSKTFRTVFTDSRDDILSRMNPTDLLLTKLLERRLLSQQQVDDIQAQEAKGSKKRRLLLTLEDCHIDLLQAFYNALTEAQQDDVVQVVSKPRNIALH